MVWIAWIGLGKWAVRCDLCDCPKSREFTQLVRWSHNRRWLNPPDGRPPIPSTRWWSSSRPSLTFNREQLSQDFVWNVGWYSCYWFRTNISTILYLLQVEGWEKLWTSHKMVNLAGLAFKRPKIVPDKCFQIRQSETQGSDWVRSHLMKVKVTKMFTSGLAWHAPWLRQYLQNSCGK